MHEDEKLEYEFIAFFQAPYDRIKYIVPGMEKSSSMQYKKFIKFLFDNFNIINRNEILNNIDSFDTIFLKTKTGEYQIVKNKKNPFDISFQDLYEFNEYKNGDSNSINNKLTLNHNLLVDKVLKSYSKLKGKKNNVSRVRIR